MSHEFDEDEWQNIQSRLDEAVKAERERIIKLLTDLNVVRRCGATDKLVAFDTDGKEVLYLTGLEQS